MRYAPIVLASVLFCVMGAFASGQAGDGWKEVPPRRDASKAKRIIFVCDAGESMTPKVATLRKELANSADGLKPSQSFNFIFMRDKGCAQMSQRLEPATSENRDKAKKFLDAFKPGGKTDPIPALEAAFKEGPDLIYLLGDHDFPDGKKLVARIAALNKNHDVAINTIAFVGEHDTDTEYMKAMDQIAHENGGVYKFVKESDL